jgi:outer membrane protein OmpA-like peptidoglycan-associated protein
MITLPLLADAGRAPTMFEVPMRIRWTAGLLLATLSNCSWLTATQQYSVYFEPYSSKMDAQAAETIQSAATFAKAHSLQPIIVSGFSAPPDPKRDVEGLSARRAETVKQMLIADGIAPGRITTEANGTTDPKGLPALAVRRVDISVGQ